MAYTMKKNIANKANYGGKRALSSVKWIVIHYTANDGDTDENNGKYFHNNVVKASSNYFVDSDSITECVPDEYAAYAVGGSKYNNAGGKYYGKCTNSNSISIELCDDVKDGKIYPSAKTIENAIAFTKLKMKQFGIKADHVIRHYDVNGKPCPAYWCGSETKDKKWKSEFWNKLSGVVNNKEDKIEKPESSAKTVNYKVKINTASGVNVRKGPGEDYSKITAIANGKTVTITKEQDGWGYAKEYKGWICLKYTKKESESSADADCIFKVGNTYILQANMVVRTGAGTNYRAKAHSELTADGQKHDKDKNGCLDKGTRVSCRKVKTIDDQIWILTPSGWICAKNGSKLYVK